MLFLITNILCAQNLQNVIDEAKPGSKIELPSGIFHGPISITKPLILKGAGKGTIIDGNASGSVISIHAQNIMIENIAIQNSGRQRYLIDSAIKIEKSNHIKIINCHIKNVLFGITMTDSDDCIIKENDISSYKERIVDNRGDGIRLWACNRNTILKNRLNGCRDLFISRSNHNIIKNNTIKNSRYGVSVQMSRYIKIIDNKILSNYVGVMCNGAKDVSIKNNFIIKTHLESGIGVMLANGKNLEVKNNTIMKHAQAFYIDSSPVENGMQRYITKNKIAFNNEAFHFHAIVKNNTIQNNNIIGNLTNVVKDIRGTKATSNNISYNYWDNYQGFDNNNDGIGDTPYLAMAYADQLWQFYHHLKFFYATPLFSMIDFIEKIAPFSEPLLLLQDNKPRRSPIKDTGAITLL